MTALSPLVNSFPGKPSTCLLVDRSYRYQERLPCHFCPLESSINRCFQPGLRGLTWHDFVTLYSGQGLANDDASSGEANLRRSDPHAEQVNALAGLAGRSSQLPPTVFPDLVMHGMGNRSSTSGQCDCPKRYVHVCKLYGSASTAKTPAPGAYELGHIDFAFQPSAKGRCNQPVAVKCLDCHHVPIHPRFI